MVAGQRLVPNCRDRLPNFEHAARAGWWSVICCRTLVASSTRSRFVRTMYTEHVNHDPASKFLHTGFQIAGRPSIGSWVTYALGSENKDLPMFVVLSSGSRVAHRATRPRGAPASSPRTTRVFSPVRGGSGRLHRRTRPGSSTAVRRADAGSDHGACAARSRRRRATGRSPRKISQYEMANRMQSRQCRKLRTPPASRSTYWICTAPT